MPFNRCQIRNEYSLADPELYKDADKDDPEALLEGVAMAGLVGVLRQLGDLAEFAAEIFHDLHEEVMATATRSHSLIARAQQLEDELPSIERKLLSQTSHTSFLYISGVDWHSNLCMDQNMVAPGDLPRFVMDSYEECRGPPQLFLLDKFDVAGVGACLKRFTDPSFFKTEATSSTCRKSGQRDKKHRRVKKRGQRSKNGNSPEAFPASHAKLHQLFLEERIETSGNDPHRRMKLKKRQFTGSLFEQDKGESYMEKFLDACSPEQSVHEICIDPLPLPWTLETCESGLDIVESMQPNKNTVFSPDTMAVPAKRSLVDFGEGEWSQIIASEAVGETGFNLESDVRKTSTIPKVVSSTSTIPKVVSSEELSQKERNSEPCSDDAQNSDEVTSEIDNYMDALATMESEIETDSESDKNSLHFNLKPIVIDFNASQGKSELCSFEALSVENSLTSEEGNQFLKKRVSSCSVSVDTLGETTLNQGEHHSMSEEIPRNKPEGHFARSTVGSGGSRSVENFGEQSNELGMVDAYVCSNIRSPLIYQHISQSTYPETLKPIFLASKPIHLVSNADSCIPLVEGHSTNQSSELDCPKSFNNQQHFSEIINLGHSPLVDFASSAVPNSQECPNVKEGVTDVHSEEEAPSAPVVDLTEILPPFSESPVTCASFSSSEIVADAETAIAGFVSPDKPNGELLSGSADGEMKDKSLIGEQSSVLDPLENLDQWQRQAEKTDAPLLDLLATTSGLYPGCVYSDELDPIESDKHLDDPEPLMLANSTSDYSFDFRHDDKNEPVSHEAFPLHSKLANDSNFVSTAGNSLDLRHDMEKVAHIETSADCSTQVHAEDYHRKNIILVSSFSSLHPEKVQEQPLSATEESNLKVEELFPSPAAELAARKRVDLVLEALGYSNSHMSNMSPVGSFNSTALNVISAEKNHCYGNSDVVRASLNSTSSSQDLESTFSHQFHLLIGKEDNGELLDLNWSQPIIPPEQRLDLLNGDSKVGSLHADELSTQSIGCSKLIQTPRYADREGSINTNDLRCPVLPSAPQLLQQSGKLVLEHSSQPTVTSSLVFPGNDTLHGYEQTSQEVENAGEPGYPRGFSAFSMLQAKPQINLDAPPLPPLPPMQWRSSKFLHSSAAPQMQMVQCTLITVQPLPATAAEISSKYNVNETREGKLSFTTPMFTRYQNGTETLADDDGVPQGVLTLPMLQDTFLSQDMIGSVQPMSEAIPEVSLNDNISEISRENNLFYTSPSSASSNCGTQVSADGHVAQQYVCTLPMLASSEVTSQDNMNEIPSGENFYSPTASTNSQMASQISEESLNGSVNSLEPGSSVQILSSGNSLAAEAKVEAEMCVQDEWHEHTPHLTELEVNSDGQFLPPSGMHPTPGFVAPEAGRTWLSASDGVLTNGDGNAYGTLQKKPPRLRNPLIDEVVALDKSKLRKVERIHSPVEPKSETGASLLGKLQLRKVERVKPSVKTTDQEGSLLEHLQLRKVGEKVQATVEEKAEEKEFFLEQLQLRKVGERAQPQESSKSEPRVSQLEQFQLRKVGERVKPEVEQKNEGAKHPRVQLRKVGERIKPEVEQIPEETESPMVQLRKVGERVKFEVEPKPEETEPPRLQLRMVGERVKAEIELRPEETESPRVQLRKVGEKTYPLVESKTDDRDSLLEQIRNRSFNLKPSVVARPKIEGSNMQGPRTNLKVAAILEKASNIRQAMVGSDEEDDTDTWSDR